MFKRGQELIVNRSSSDDRRMTATFQNSNHLTPAEKDLVVNRVKMLVIANSVCLQLVVWSAVDENSNIFNF